MEEVLLKGKKQKRLHGKVERVIKPVLPGEQERAQIDIHEADDLYREIRVENVLTDDDGQKRQLEKGADVDVIIEADSDATTKKPD